MSGPASFPRQADGQHRCLLDGHELDHRGFASALRSRPDLRDALTAALRDAPHEAIFWECSPTGGPLRFVVLDAPSLARAAPDPGPFREHCRDGDGLPQVRAFASLGGDARLVAPCRMAPDPVYTHLLSFLRHAPDAQIHALWEKVGEELARARLHRPVPLWLSTSGLGVHWLHVRIDTRPKYIQHRPYRSTPG